MQYSFLLATLASTSYAATVRRQSDNTQPSGSNPVVVSNVEYLGEQIGSNSCTHRDLGFTGELGGQWYGVYGDTLFCAEGVTDPSQDDDGFHGMVRDAVARLTDDPLTIEWTSLDEGGHPTQFVPYSSSWGETGSTGFGGTSICSVDDQTGVVFYLVLEDDTGAIGAGVGRIEITDDAPVVTERLGDSGYWWPVSENPRYGDVAAYRDVNSDYIYAWGGAPGSASDEDGQLVYQIRVNAADAFNLDSYEYWWGREQGWKVGEPLTEFTTETAVMNGVGQGQVVYSPFYETYMYVHFNGGDVAIRTAPQPEGPWSDDVGFYTPEPYPDGLVYAPMAYPYLDESGETLTIGFTNFNHIPIITATFGSNGSFV